MIILLIDNFSLHPMFYNSMSLFVHYIVVSIYRRGLLAVEMLYAAEH